MKKKCSLVYKEAEKSRYEIYRAIDEGKESEQS
ncbi:hypothetical protein PAECIP111802_04970 [Paenibacillus allorhizosphaerae]|uniref:Uncharacterized protein n=1 Tax=Paenibacillus allorhizosphaerae TaxID=2849866 RepID=A0ABM8VNG4_9BACL|nr:hypothetical protein PAECIP111802_04970 [Paenibacillus allorhizosphaerae]